MRSLLVFLGLASLAVAASSSAPPPGRTFPYAYEKHTLPNGLTAILIPMESPGIVAYYSIVRTGSRDEVEEGKSGFAHFFEHMMFRGTKKYSSAAYEAILTKAGASHNAFTTDDFTAYHIKFSKDDLEQVMDLESDRFQHLEYPKIVFQTEAGAVYGEYRKNITSPFSLLHEKLHDVAYDRHTYKHTTIGFERDIQAMPTQFDYSLSFFKRFYRPENVVLLMVGDIQPKATRAMIEKYYGGWTKGYTPPQIVPEPPQQAERTAEVTYPGKTLPILDIAYKGDALDPNNRDFVAALLLEELAFGETSEIHKKLVIQEQKAQNLGSDVPLNRDPSLITITAIVKKPEDIDYIRDEVYRTIDQFQQKPVDAKRLSELKRRNRYSFLMGLDTPGEVAAQLARFIALTGDIAVIDALYSKMNDVTAEDIMHAARKYFVPERRTVVVLKGGQS